MISRGSEWRKWNLHLHSIYSKESRTKITIEQIFGYAEQNEIAMIAVTDHNNFDGLDEIWRVYEEKYAENGKIDFLPGIELKTNKGQRGVHLISLFPKEVVISGITKKAVKETLYDNFCAPLGLTKNKIEGAGGGEYAAGLLNATVDFDRAIALTKELGGIVIVHGGDKHGSIENEMSHVHTKNPTPEQIYHSLDITKTEILENKIDVVELPNYNVREKKNARFYMDMFGLPCMLASDAHDSLEYETILSEKFTWVKADTSFAGLQQALIDYENRMYIGSLPEELDRVQKNPTKYIDNLSVDWVPEYNGSQGKWFQDLTIPINSGLVSVIGNKGNGKSALAEIIGLMADSKNYKKFSFLTKERFKQNRLARNFEAQVQWKNGEIVQKNLFDNSNEDAVERCQCIPQQYFEDICTDIEFKNFSKEINGVIFSQLPEADKEGAKSFDELIKNNVENINLNIGQISLKLHQMNQEIYAKELKQEPSYDKQQNAILENVKAKLAAHENNKPKEVAKPELNPERQAAYDSLLAEIDSLENQKADLQEKINQYVINLRALHNAIGIFELLESQFSTAIENANQYLIDFDLDANDILKLTIDRAKIDEKIQVLEKEKQTKEALLYSDETSIINQIEKMVAAKDQIVAEDSKNLHMYDQYQNELAEWNQSKAILLTELADVQNEIDYITERINDDLELLYDARMQIAREIFTEKKKIISLYDKLKAPVDVFLKENEELLSDYKVAIKSGLLVKSDFETTVFNFVNKQKRNVFRDDNYKLNSTIEELLELDESEDLFRIPKLILSKMKNFSNGSIIEQVKNERVVEFYDYLFGFDYLENKYDLINDGKTLDKLSPGERGALLLIFYLLLDLRDIPLIIDQPEDNLDNQSVAKILVPFIKRAKQRRQIILVTHNPNLAVVADSDQIIYVSIDKENHNSIQVESGGIENLEINNHVVSILEGTMQSFKKREQKYFVKE